MSIVLKKISSFLFLSLYDLFLYPYRVFLIVLYALFFFSFVAPIYIVVTNIPLFVVTTLMVISSIKIYLFFLICKNKLKISDQNQSHSLFSYVRCLGQMLFFTFFTIIKTLIYILCIALMGVIVSYIITGENLNANVWFSFDSTGLGAAYESKNIVSSITLIAVSVSIAWSVVHYLLNMILALQMVRNSSLLFSDARNRAYEVLRENKIFVLLPVVVFILKHFIISGITYALFSLLLLPLVVVYAMLTLFISVITVYMWLLVINVAVALINNHKD